MSDFHQRLDEFEERLKLELGRLETSLKQQFVAYGQHIESLFNQGRESIASHIDVLRGTPISDEQSAATLLSNVNEELHKTPAAADLEAAKKEFAAANVNEELHKTPAAADLEAAKKE